MKIAIDREELQRTLAQCRGLFHARTINLITHQVLVTADAQGVEIAASNLDVSFRRKLDGIEVSERGRCLLPGGKLERALDSMRCDAVELTAEDDNAIATLATYSGKGPRFELWGGDPEEFPAIGNVNGPELRLSGSDFAQAVRAIGRSVAQERGRYALDGMLLEFADGAAQLVATDGRRLAVRRMAAKGALPEHDVIIPPGMFNLIALASGDAELLLRFSKAGATPGESMQAFCNGAWIGGALSDGVYPDWRGVMPKPDKKFTVDRADFAQALKQALVMTSIEHQAATFELKPGSLTLSTNAPATGSAKVEIEAETDAEARMGFDPGYVLPGVEGFGSERLTFEFLSPTDGAIMHGGDRENAFYLVMPVDL